MTARMGMAQRPEEVDDFFIEEALKRGLPVPPEVELAYRQRQVLQQGLGSKSTGSFADYVQLVNPSLMRYEHIPKLIDVGERIIARELDRVMVLMPPRYFKSEVFSRLLPGYYLIRYGVAQAMLTCFTAHLAWELAEGAKANYLKSGGVVGAISSQERWTTAMGGMMRAIGMGGTITGRGFHLGVVDDPIHPEHANSPTYQRKFAHWWSDTWIGRQEPHMTTGRQLAQMLVVMQRLGPSDPIDYLLRREVGEQTDLAPECWHVVVMDEVKSDEPLGRWKGPRGLPETCTIEPDHRKPGMILAPSRFPQPAVTSAQSGAGPLAAAAQRQQRPMQATGAFWQSDWFGTYNELPEHAYDGGVDWDTAYSQEEDHSASAYCRSYRGPAPKDRPDEFPIYIEDVGWEWLEFPGLIYWMGGNVPCPKGLVLTPVKGPHWVEAKATGKSAVQVLKTYGIMAREVTVPGDKLARASAAQPIASAGRVFVSARAVRKLLWGERQGLLRITAEALQMGKAEGLDVNDCFVQSIYRHAQLGEKRRRIISR